MLEVWNVEKCSSELSSLILYESLFRRKDPFSVDHHTDPI